MAEQAVESTENDEYSALGQDLEAAWDNSSPEIDDGVEEKLEPEISAEATEEKETPAVEESAEPEKEIAEDDTPAEAIVADAVTVPVGLSPEAREVWKDTPPAMQKAIAKREKEFAVGVQRYAEGAKRAEGMDRALQPYQQYLAMNGGTKHIGALLQTGAGLQMGSPIQKAQTVANLIKLYGIDIGTLDSMLVGETPPQQVQQQQPQNNPEMQEIRQFMNYQRQQVQDQQQHSQQQVVSSVDMFSQDPKNEFYNDVKMDMADLMDMSANRGEEMSLPDAYARACQMNQSISSILNSRRSASEISTKRKAATSISGGPGGPGGNSMSGSRRSAIEDIWDSAGRT